MKEFQKKPRREYLASERLYVSIRTHEYLKPKFQRESINFSPNVIDKPVVTENGLPFHK